jgi:hypothetical protein
VRNWHIFNLNGCVLIEFLELVCCEISTQIGDDSVREAEPM